MRSGITAVVVGTLLVSTGCTHIALERRTVKQASTLTDLQHQQVLDNLAMFACNPDALAWHVKLKDGVVQIADQGGAGFTADIATAMGGEPTRLLPSASAQRGILNQWNVEPAVGSDELELLTLAYRKAVNPTDERIGKDLRFAIWKLVVTYDIAPGVDVLLDIIQDAVTDEFEGLQQELAGVAVDASLTPVIQHERTRLGEALSKLKEAVEKQRPGEDHQVGKLVDEAVAQLTSTRSVLESWKPAVRKEAQTVFDKIIRRISLIKKEEGTVKKDIENLNPAEARKKELERRRSPFWAQFRPKEDPPYPDVRFIRLVGSSKYLLPQAKAKPQMRNPGLIDQAEEKVTALKSLLEEKAFQSPWFISGGKKDVPKCACHVGHYCACGCECYVWVLPDRRQVLKEFTLVILALAPIEAQDVTGGRGAAFSPGLR
ncbi:MAG: hypothetical protein K2W96_03735 [Gemmataceae bacterium]|nr:hypothetical protein [Gemmataceae bacterium]